MPDKLKVIAGILNCFWHLKKNLLWSIGKIISHFDRSHWRRPSHRQTVTFLQVLLHSTLFSIDNHNKFKWLSLCKNVLISRQRFILPNPGIISKKLKKYQTKISSLLKLPTWARQCSKTAVLTTGFRAKTKHSSRIPRKKNSTVVPWCLKVE